MNDQRQFDIGVLGCGSIGLRHIRNAVSLGCAVAAFDPSADRLGMAQDIGAVSAPGRNELFDMCRIALIASPSGHHAEDLSSALGQGCHVLVEKPFTTSEPAALHGVLRRAEAAGLSVAAAMNMRFNPVVQAARDLLERVDFGRAVWARFQAGSFLPDWRPAQDYRHGYAVGAAHGGAIFDFVHELDLALFFLGNARLLAAAPHRSGLLELAAEDLADIVLLHTSGCQSTVHVDYVTRPRRRCFELAFEKGLVTGDLEAGSLRAWNADGSVLVASDLPGDHNSTYVQMLRNFLDHIRTGSALICTAEEALRASELAIHARSAGAPGVR